MDRKIILEKVADRMALRSDETWGMNIEKFDWGPGVGLYGIWNAYEATKQERYLTFLEGWAKRHLMEAKDKLTVNSTAPLLTIEKLYEVTGKEEYVKVCRELAEYIIDHAEKTKEGALGHTTTEMLDAFSDQIWADTMFMSCIFMGNLGRAVQEPRYIRFAQEQLVLHYKYLWDEESCLFYHGWNSTLQNHMSAVHWGRANAWMLCATMEILGVSSAFEGRQEVVERFQKTINRLADLQRENGLFGTVPDRADSYDEASASAGIACAMLKARKAGYLGEDMSETIEKAVSTLVTLVNDEGELLKVSGGTPVMADVEGYLNIACYTTLYGQGLMCMLLKESM